MARKSKSKKNQTADINPPDPKEDAPPPKDREEEELEKLVFGDLAGFKAGLRAHEEGSEAEEEAEDFDHDAGKEGNLAALQDDEVGHCFFFFLLSAMSNIHRSCFSWMTETMMAVTKTSEWLWCQRAAVKKRQHGKTATTKT